MTVVDRTLFIAAGSGLRLGPRGVQLPKGLLKIGSGPTRSGDEVWVWAGGTTGQPTLDALSKSSSFRPDVPFGELVGIVRIGETLRKRLLDVIRRAEAIRLDVPYETCLASAAAEIAVDLVHIDDLLWSEIDDEAMYTRVRNTVWPSIFAAAAKPSLRRKRFASPRDSSE